MTVFDVIKENLTTRQIISNEGFYISRNGMMKCPFHDDHHPSLNVKERFKCFACGEYGDGINFVAKLYGLSLLNAAKKIADSFNLSYNNNYGNWSMKSIRQVNSDRVVFAEKKRDLLSALSALVSTIALAEREYAPSDPEDATWHPFYIEAIQMKDYVLYLYDYVLFEISTTELEKEMDELTQEVGKLGRKFDTVRGGHKEYA